MTGRTLYNDKFTNGIIGPSAKMVGPAVDGDVVVFETTPGCWGPMITPNLKGGHEVSLPVAIKGAKVGDAIVIRIKDLEVKSKASSSGTDKAVEGAFVGDPYVYKKCPKCGDPWPKAVVKGIGIEAVKCAKCGASVSPFTMVNGYTMVFDEAKRVGVTIGKGWAEKIAKEARNWSGLPKNSIQTPILIAAKADLVGVISRLRPFVGQLGTTPSVDIPDSHNAGDFGAFLVNAPHPYAITQKQLDECRTDGHLDVSSVRKGAILIAPVKLEGGGVYAGDMHAMQADGEVAGHTTDVAGKLTVEVGLIEGLTLSGPILLPPEEDLPSLLRPFTFSEWDCAKELGEAFGVETERAAPIQIIGTGADLNKATVNGLERAADLLKMGFDDIRNRVTLSGGVKIGRLPGVVQVNLLAPIDRLEKIRIADIVREQYKLPF